MADTKRQRTYIAIDLKSFYASVECARRNLDPLTTNLVVADPSRTEKTICLAVSPSLKAIGVGGRARLFEVIEKVKAVNCSRLAAAPGRKFTGKSWDDQKLKADPSLELDFYIAPPKMADYMKVSASIYQIYLKYAAPEDIHVYSIDEVFIDVTTYLAAWKKGPRDLAMTMILDVLHTTGITATAGIAPNLYLCKVAMDIVAKHIPADANGVRIACLDEDSYRRTLWSHQPLTDFWRVGRGIAKKLQENGLYTMGDIARCSIGRPDQFYNEDLLYRLLGVNAELLIDHAWGWEPCQISDIKAYRPENNSVGSGQVLHCPYNWEDTRLVVKEMADLLALDLLEQGLCTSQLVLTIGYDRENLQNEAIRKEYHGPVVTDHYGRKIPGHAHGSIHLQEYTSSGRQITERLLQLYDEITNKKLLVRRINLTAANVISESEAAEIGRNEYRQLDLFTDEQALEAEKEARDRQLAKERKMQEAELAIRKKYGKNAILKGMNLQKQATAIDRNQQIGGHKA